MHRFRTTLLDNEVTDPPTASLCPSVCPSGQRADRHLESIQLSTEYVCVCVGGAGRTGQVFFPQLSRSKASSTSAFLPSNFQQVGQARPCGMEAVHPPLWIPLRARDALCSLDWKGFKARWGHYAVMLCLFPWTPISRLSHGPCGCKALSLPVKLTWRAVSCQLTAMNLFNLRELKLVLPVSFGMKI